MSKLAFVGNDTGTATYTLKANTGAANTENLMPLTSGTLLNTSNIATQSQAEAGTNNETLMTPLRVKQAIGNLALTRFNAVPAANTAVDFVGIPAGVKRITVMFNAVSSESVSPYLIQIGDSGGIEPSGYVSGSARTAASGATSYILSTSGFVLASLSGPELNSGIMTITSLGSNVWVASHVLNNTLSCTVSGGGTKTLSDTLDRVRITTIAGDLNNEFDAGTIAIMYE